MYKVKRDNGCFTISNNDISVDIKPIPSDRSTCGGIFVIFGIFSLLENSKIIDQNARIYLFEAVSAFNDYLKSMPELAKFSNVTVINTQDVELKHRALEKLKNYQVRDIRMMMNPRIYKMAENTYGEILKEINLNISKNKYPDPVQAIHVQQIPAGMEILR